MVATGTKERDMYGRGVGVADAGVVTAMGRWHRRSGSAADDSRGGAPKAAVLVGSNAAKNRWV